MNLLTMSLQKYVMAVICEVFAGKTISITLIRFFLDCLPPVRKRAVLSIMICRRILEKIV